MNSKQLTAIGMFSLGIGVLCDLAGSRDPFVMITWLLGVAMLFVSVAISTGERRSSALETAIVDQLRRNRKPPTQGELLPIQRNLFEHLCQIEGERNLFTSLRAHDKARDYIAEKFAESGWEVSLQPFRFRRRNANNIVATKRGRTDRVILVTAHYDTVQGSPGVDDNGSGVAGVLALAHQIAGADLEYTVKLVVFDLEEQQGVLNGGIIGSTYYVRHNSDDIACVINFEMIGMCRREPNSQKTPSLVKWISPDLYQAVEDNDHRGDFILAVGNQPANEFCCQFAHAAKQRQLNTMTLRYQGLVRLIRDARRSDHAPFWSRNIPAIMLTDTANFRDGFYHTALDTVDGIDFEFAARVVQATIDVITGTCLDAVSEVSDARNRRAPVEIGEAVC